jgi:hypothetical protein
MSLLVISSQCSNILLYEQLNDGLKHLFNKVLIDPIECHIVLVFIGKVTLSFHCYCVNIDFANIYFQIAYIEYQIVLD